MTTTEDTHLALWESEKSVSGTAASWYAWIDKVQSLLVGWNLDGDQIKDGYSMDGFYDQWKTGWSPEAAARTAQDHTLNDQKEN